MQSNSDVDPDAQKLMDFMASVARMSALRGPMLAFLTEQKLGHAQASSLVWLRTDGPMTMGAMAQRCGVTDKTVTGLVDRLERDGWVVRERSDSDRRVVQVALSARGLKLANQLHRKMLERFSFLLSTLKSQDRKDLFRILNHLVEQLAAANAAMLGNVE